MNKIVNINLGGYPFSIDEDAHKRLKHYFASLNSHFAHSYGKEEIISDIENRIAELFRESMMGRQIVTLRDVDYAIQIMGSPDEFEDIEFGEEPTDRQWKFRPGKRLFRDPDDKVIGGVCAGISAYLGIQDPVWVRIAFAIIFFTAGFGLPLYIILWAVVPEAKTAADRLAMMGEKINVDNIAKMVEEGMHDLSESINDTVKTFSPKKKELAEKLEIIEPERVTIEDSLLV